MFACVKISKLSFGLVLAYKFFGLSEIANGLSSLLILVA